MANIERALATIRIIKSLSPIEGADRIELAKFTTCGWQCVVNKGLYEAGDKVIFCEIDSWMPDSIAPFLTKSGQFPKEYNGIAGQRLKSIKLKGVLSQGLVLPFRTLYRFGISVALEASLVDGEDVTQILGIQKWERPVDNRGKNGGAYAKPAGSFPTHLVSKTDQERIQNFAGKVSKYIMENGGIHAEVTEKLDGSSMTMIVHDGEFMVCSRNNKLKEPTPEDEGVNNFWNEAKKFKDNIVAFHNSVSRNIAIQGELLAWNIQGNPYKLKEGETRFYCFDVFDIDNQRYLSSLERIALIEALGIPGVPVLFPLVMEPEDLDTIDDLCSYFLEMADGESKLAKVKREGIVFKSVDATNFTWKAISNQWLLSGGDGE